MKIQKKCGCGKLHTEIPKDAKKWVDEGVHIGWLWNCTCNSTLFVPTFTLKNLIRKEAS
jgi:hypothetical protein